MKCFLAGSKELAVQTLELLVASGHQVVAVLTRDHEAGMQIWHQQLGHRSLAERARELEIPVLTCGINESQCVPYLEQSDVAFSVFWGEMVGELAMSLPRLGFFNLHTAHLPKNRGCWPMAWALLEGESQCGATLHRMLKGPDTGPILDQESVAITSEDTGESLYRRVSAAGLEVMKRSLPKLSGGPFQLRAQDESAATYHPRGFPYGRQPNPYWSDQQKDRLRRALTFPPFLPMADEPAPSLQGPPGVRVMLGFDCDRPRGSWIASSEGRAIAQRKLESLRRLNARLEGLQIPRTFFVCGQFLESMAHLFGDAAMQEAFAVASPLVEIADHTYSHSTLTRIATRPDKQPMKPLQMAAEWAQNGTLLEKILGRRGPRGLRSPLGSRFGLQKEISMVDRLARLGVTYVSSALRDENDSLHPKLLDAQGVPRQPFRYANGLLEIPSVGWQDTAFSGLSQTRLFERPPQGLPEIGDYFRSLFREASHLVERFGRDQYLGLVMHPLDLSHYDPDVQLFAQLRECAVSWHSYAEIAAHYDAPLTVRT